MNERTNDGWLAFEIEEESSLSQTGETCLESNEDFAGIDGQNLFPEGPTVLEVDPVFWRDLEELVAFTGSLDIQLEVEERDTDDLAALNCQAPPTLGVHVVLARIVGTRHVPFFVEDGIPLTRSRTTILYTARY